MTNEKKLELTLCGMLPYGLKCRTKKGDLILTEYSIHERWKAWFHFPYGSKNKILKYNYENVVDRDCVGKGFLLSQVKPFLHSLDKISQEHYSEILGIEVEFLEDGKAIWQTFNPYGIVDHEYFLKLETNEEGDFAIIEYYSIDGKEKEPKILDYLKFEELKKLHVNIYDLPSEMYIEKSINNLNLKHNE